MTHKGWIIVSAILFGFALVATAVALQQRSIDTTLSFQVLDEVSGSWVWDLEAKLQSRVIKGYFQSDTKPLPGFTFTRLERGESELLLSAPNYLPQRIPVALKRGANTIPEPLTMTGVAIPGLSQIFAFESYRKSDVICELRPVNSSGAAIKNHPALDIWVGCEISVQMRDGIPITEPTQSASTRGDRLFKGSLAWEWDATPETLFRYSATIPGGEILEHPASFWVIDYLIALRDPRKIEKAEMDRLMGEVWELSEDEDFLTTLQQYDGISFYFDTTWNFERK